MPIKLQVKARSIVAEFSDGRKALIGEFEVDCPACGPVEIRIAGHHMKALRDCLIEWLDAYPDLTDLNTDIQVVQRFNFGGSGSRNPENN